MANPDHIAQLEKGVEAWNAWRDENPDIGPDLSEADFTWACKAHLGKANLKETDLSEADLIGANLSEANLIRAKLIAANLTDANLSGANLWGANLMDANLSEADLTGAYLSGADLSHAYLLKAHLSKANLRDADLALARLTEANLCKALLEGADIWGANLKGAHLVGARLNGAKLSRADLRGANLSPANLREVDLRGANLRKANLSGADLSGANLTEANLSGADLSGAGLAAATLVRTDLTRADLTGCCIYGISAWGLKLKNTKQQNLVITPDNEPEVTVDNVEVAQFIYLLLHNKKIRDVIDTIGKKGVLLLGRFTDGRMKILERLREKLRTFGYLPMVFNFDKSEIKNFTETVRLLANLSHFVIVDITNPKSTPLELQATVPDYMVPFAPILQQGEKPFAMFVDLQNQYDWVLQPVIAYPSADRLLEVLEDKIVRPAEAKFNQLLARRANKLRVKKV
jgi:uncharacterized protein YjbI with pentapeptide repeats